jgi:hypothetical protein
MYLLPKKPFRQFPTALAVSACYAIFSGVKPKFRNTQAAPVLGFRSRDHPGNMGIRFPLTQQLHRVIRVGAQ